MIKVTEHEMQENIEKHHPKETHVKKALFDQIGPTGPYSINTNRYKGAYKTRYGC